MNAPSIASATIALLLPAVLLLGSLAVPVPGAFVSAHPVVTATDQGAVNNFSAALQRIVTLLGLSGSALLAIVWARVALSWFSNDLSKKIQAKDRARDALVGTLLFTAAFTGLAWGLARWVLTGS
ncbi:MAG: hypothetical protein L3K19_02925 [Thermoplasmata archaeon]|nr:hypothetical protein [Thermoplasmata archaeon]